MRTTLTIACALLSTTGAAAAPAASTATGSLAEEARQLDLRTREVRLLLARETKDTEELAARRDQVGSLKAEMDDLGAKFVAAKPGSRNRTPEQVALYNQIQSELASKEARLTETSARLAALEDEVASRQRRIAGRLVDDGAEAARLETALAAFASPAPAASAATPVHGRPLGVVRAELQRERDKADELRARIAYEVAVKDAGDADTHGLESDLAREEKRIAALQQELTALEVSRRTGAKKVIGPSAAATRDLTRVRLALADHDLLVVESELNALTVEATSGVTADASPERRAQLESERSRLTDVVSRLQANLPTP